LIEEGLSVHACVALDLSVAGFKPSGGDHSWLEIDWRQEKQPDHSLSKGGHAIQPNIFL